MLTQQPRAREAPTPMLTSCSSTTWTTWPPLSAIYTQGAVAAREICLQALQRHQHLVGLAGHAGADELLEHITTHPGPGHHAPRRKPPARRRRAQNRRVGESWPPAGRQPGKGSCRRSSAPAPIASSSTCRTGRRSGYRPPAEDPAAPGQRRQPPAARARPGRRGHRCRRSTPRVRPQPGKPPAGAAAPPAPGRPGW